MGNDWTLTLKNLWFPIFCQECGRRLLTDENGYFCPMCWELSRRIERPFCTVCGVPHQGREGFGSPHNFPCGECHLRKSPPPYDRVYGAAYYEGAIAKAVKLFKFYDKRHLAGPLAEVMAEFAQGELDCKSYDVLAPVPLHKVKQRHRGFNQSERLAERLAEVFPNAGLDTSLRRIRPTMAQSGLKSEQARRENVIGAFAVDRAREFEGGKVLLVDDVVTTGGTGAECAAALKRAGAGQVDVLAVALAVKEPGTRRDAEERRDIRLVRMGAV